MKLEIAVALPEADCRRAVMEAMREQGLDSGGGWEEGGSGNYQLDVRSERACFFDVFDFAKPPQEVHLEIQRGDVLFPAVVRLEAGFDAGVRQRCWFATMALSALWATGAVSSLGNYGVSPLWVGVWFLAASWAWLVAWPRRYLIGTRIQEKICAALSRKVSSGKKGVVRNPPASAGDGPACPRVWQRDPWHTGRSLVAAVIALSGLALLTPLVGGLEGWFRPWVHFGENHAPAGYLKMWAAAVTVLVAATAWWRVRSSATQTAIVHNTQVFLVLSYAWHCLAILWLLPGLSYQGPLGWPIWGVFLALVGVGFYSVCGVIKSAFDFAETLAYAWPDPRSLKWRISRGGGFAAEAAYRHSVLAVWFVCAPLWVILLSVSLLLIFVLIASSLSLIPDGWFLARTLALPRTGSLGALSTPVLLAVTPLAVLWLVLAGTYWFAGLARIAAGMVCVTPLSREERQKIPEVGRICTAAGLAWQPDFRIVESNALIAKVTWFHRIHISRRAIDELNEDEKFCMLAHEIGHLQAHAGIYSFLMSLSDLTLFGYSGLTCLFLNSQEMERAADSFAFKECRSKNISWSTFDGLLTKVQVNLEFPELASTVPAAMAMGQQFPVMLRSLARMGDNFWVQPRRLLRTLYVLLVEGGNYAYVHLDYDERRRRWQGAENA